MERVETAARPTADENRMEAEHRTRRRGRPSPTDAVRPRPLMTERASTRLRVECTECDFEMTLVRSAEGWSADAVADHAERTGHTLRSIPLDG